MSPEAKHKAEDVPLHIMTSQLEYCQDLAGCSYSFSHTFNGCIPRLIFHMQISDLYHKRNYYVHGVNEIHIRSFFMYFGYK